jgi:hypothetical protein
MIFVHPFGMSCGGISDAHFFPGIFVLNQKILRCFAFQNIAVALME